MIDVVRKILRLVRERLHLAVGEDVDRAFLVAQHDRAQVDFLDEPALAIDDRDVADAALVLEDQEEAGDDVAHDRLRAETDRQPRDAGARQRRRDVDAQLAQDHQSPRCR